MPNREGEPGFGTSQMCQNGENHSQSTDRHSETRSLIGGKGLGKDDDTENVERHQGKSAP